MTSYYPYQPTGIIWVSGEAGAKAYLVAPNNTVQLWDSESQTIYLKSADACGMPICPGGNRGKQSPDGRHESGIRTSVRIPELLLREQTRNGTDSEHCAERRRGNKTGNPESDERYPRQTLRTGARTASGTERLSAESG